MILKALWLINERTKIDPFGDKYKQTRANKWNPLTYIWIGLMIPLGVFAYGWSDTMKSLKGVFDWR